ESARQRAFEPRPLLRPGAGAGSGRGTGVGDGFERFALMAHIALNGLEEIGDQIGTALQLHVDAGPALLHQLPLPDQVVVEKNGVADDGDDNRQNDQASHVGVSSRRRVPERARPDWHCGTSYSTGGANLNLDERRRSAGAAAGGLQPGGTAGL